MIVESRFCSIAKQGNFRYENADACRVVQSDTKTLAAVADGVGSSLYARLWACILTKRFTQDLDEDDWWTDDGISRVITQAGFEWCERANKRIKHKFGDSVPFYVEGGLIEGASSTLLGVEIRSEHYNGKCPSGISWRAVAVGDSCLFHVRDGQCLKSFPMLGSDQFTFLPNLAHAAHWRKQSKPDYDEGFCIEGDSMILTTDALAEAVLRTLEKVRAEGRSEAEIWKQLLAERTREEWHDHVARERQSGVLHDDDTAMITICIPRAE